MDIKRLYRMHKLILQEATGAPDEFAERFHIKRRQLFNLLGELKDYGAPIEYSAINNTYYYTEDFDFFKRIGMESLSGKENKAFLQEILKKALTVQ
jgi:predicted DNA-binding transcriptional regulator YafY